MKAFRLVVSAFRALTAATVEDSIIHLDWVDDNSSSAVMLQRAYVPCTACKRSVLLLADVRYVCAHCGGK